jgi:hypothetical protein
MSNNMLNDWLSAYFPKDKPVEPLPPPIVGEAHHEVDTIPEAELDAGQAAVRADVNASGYGQYVSDERCRGLASQVLIAAAAVRESNPDGDEDEEQDRGKKV